MRIIHGTFRARDMLIMPQLSDSQLMAAWMLHEKLPSGCAVLIPA